jgi:hypothetical protein
MEDTMRYYLFASVAGLAFLTPPALPSMAAPPQAASTSSEPEKVLLGTFYLSENGCHTSSKTIEIQIPNAAKLDRTHPGTVGGTEIVLTAANHGSVTDMHITGDKVIVTATATGPGHWLDNPIGHLFGGGGNGGVCLEAEGADVGGQVYGYFLTDDAS